MIGRVARRLFSTKPHQKTLVIKNTLTLFQQDKQKSALNLLRQSDLTLHGTTTDLIQLIRNIGAIKNGSVPGILSNIRQSAVINNPMVESNPTYLSTMGLSYLRTGQHEEAKALFEEALAIEDCYLETKQYICCLQMKYAHKMGLNVDAVLEDMKSRDVPVAPSMYEFMIGQFGGHIGKMVEKFEELKKMEDVHMAELYANFIRVSSRHDLRVALKYFHRMKEEFYKPSHAVYSDLVNSICRCKDTQILTKNIKVAEGLIDEMRGQLLTPGPQLYASLITANVRISNLKMSRVWLRHLLKSLDVENTEELTPEQVREIDQKKLARNPAVYESLITHFKAFKNEEMIKTLQSIRPQENRR